jgi:7-cyano-7-deazaguanine reductase
MFPHVRLGASCAGMREPLHDDLPLGRSSPIPDAYAPQVLRGIPRAAARVPLGIALPLPFGGEDVWNAYELSWLSERGQPRAALGVLRFPCSSPQIVESKSLKLYLASLHQERIGDAARVQCVVGEDLGRVAGAPVEVHVDADLDRKAPLGAEADPVQLDVLDVAVDCYRLAPELLFEAAARAPRGASVRETLCTHAFRSLCPVTAQPDCASIRVAYEGRPIEHAALLRYLVSFRTQQEFHEACIERIFWDVWRAWQPAVLSVEGRFTRRGGLDINPFRSSAAARSANARTIRQ